jgi:hypothetical protein
MSVMMTPVFHPRIIRRIAYVADQSVRSIRVAEATAAVSGICRSVRPFEKQAYLLVL